MPATSRPGITSGPSLCVGGSRAFQARPRRARPDLRHHDGRSPVREAARHRYRPRPFDRRCFETYRARRDPTQRTGEGLLQRLGSTHGAALAAENLVGLLRLRPSGIRQALGQYADTRRKRLVRFRILCAINRPYQAARRFSRKCLIVSGECPGPYVPNERVRPMRVKWAIDLRDQAAAANIPFFLRRMAKNKPVPRGLQIRKFPSVNTERCPAQPCCSHVAFSLMPYSAMRGLYP